MFYLLILCLFIVVISRLLAYANQGADRGKLLHVALPEYTVMPDIHVKDDGNEGSEITSFIIDQIKTDYVNARERKVELVPLITLLTSKITLLMK